MSRLRYTVRLTLLCFLVFLILGAYTLTLLGHIENCQVIKQGYQSELAKDYRIIQGLYGRMSESIFKLFIDTPAVLSRVREAVSAEDAVSKDAAREALFHELEPIYRNITEYNFRQLHFHEPDNRSLLRFHRPEKFGDDLTGIRYSVEYVNRTKSPASGFEEGRIYNGHRFVYPLFLEGEHLGSVEVSISMKTVVDILEVSFAKKVQFLLSFEEVREKVFAEELENYVPWKIDDRFVLDRNVSEECILGDVRSPRMLTRISKAFDAVAGEGASFGLTVRLQGARRLLSFIPVRDLEGRTVAWFFSMDQAEDLARENRIFAALSGAFSLILVLLVLFLLYFATTQRKIEHMATYDALTGCFTREVLMQRIGEEDERYARYQTIYSLIMLDIDRFKAVNDTYGHHAGDVVLKGISSIIKSNIRRTDILGRYGGEEFLILLPFSSVGKAADVAEKLRSGIAGSPFRTVGTITVSCGVAERTAEAESFESVIRDADEKLYVAKEAGRNRVVS